jgi:hypothetical protein
MGESFVEWRHRQFAFQVLGKRRLDEPVFAVEVPVGHATLE